MNDTMKLYISTLKLSIKLSFKASKTIMVFRLIMLISGAIIPLINARSMKCIIDSIASLDAQRAIKWFVALGCCQIISAFIGKTTNYLSVIHSDRISLLISKDIAEKVNELDISYFDNPVLYNELKNVTADIRSIPSLIWQVLSSFQLLIKIVSTAIILWRYIAFAPIIVIISCLPSLLIDKKYARKMYEWNRSTTSEARKMGYSYDTLTSKYFCKDIRMYGLKKYLLDKYEEQWNIWKKRKHNIIKNQFRASIISVLLPNIVTLLFAILIMIKILHSYLSVGDFSYFISIMGQLTVAVSGMVSVVAEIINQKTKIEYYNRFGSWESVIRGGHKSINSFNELIFDNVSFAYPGTQNLVLSNVSFRITKNQKVGIIGKNGSGKSTIIKLIMRFYNPTSGRILVNGRNVQEYDMSSYYGIISCFMQDYVNYCFSLKENIQTADLRKKGTLKELVQACKKSDAYSFVNSWENGMEQFLTKSFDETGKELSGGEWQKIALARFFFRNSELKIMDEPSSSIDLQSEEKILSSVINEQDHGTLILVSHRLSNMKKMDQILVVENGKIVEKGDHESLMNAGKIYYHLYSIQKNNFQ